MTNSNAPKQGLSRTRLAREAGVGVETIRYYERRGLIESPDKLKHSHPLYSRRALEQLKFVKRAQEAGFTLKEIATLLSLGSGHCSVTKLLAQEKLETIRNKIIGLQGEVGLLQVLIRQCDANDEQGKCALFEALQDVNR
jgi:MerR family transcriptional regulator, mercuric resistance operon regulatory protein